MQITFKPLRDPLALLVLGSGAVTAVLSGSWWLAPLGGAGYLLIAWQGFLSANRRAASATPSPVEPPVLSGEQALTYERLMQRAGRIRSALRSADPMVQTMCADTADQVVDLVENCRSLLAKQARLDQFLEESGCDDPVAELARLEKSTSQSTDPEVRRRWEKTRANIRSRIDSLNRIRNNREGMVADLSEVETCLKEIHSRIVSLDSLDEPRLTGMTGEVQQLLGDVRIRIDASERVLEPQRFWQEEVSPSPAAPRSSEPPHAA